jgi:5'-3' exoribonuclease 1
MSFSFALGQPFKPFEQLMGVLPVASMEHIPPAYRVCIPYLGRSQLLTLCQDLMNDVNSPILDFYPLEFEQDLNGKKQEWEAVVKIPFIDEKRLLKAMAGMTLSVSSSFSLTLLITQAGNTVSRRKRS